MLTDAITILKSVIVPCILLCLFLGCVTVDRGEPEYDSVKISRRERANSSNEAEDEDR